jgi:hypothetical protein
MKFNNLGDILNCMREWNSIRDNATDVTEALTLGNFFSFNRDTQASNLHAYPGLCTADSQLFMFLIDADSDKALSEIELFDAITICTMQKNLGHSDEIPEVVAQQRINKWTKDFTSWATDQINHRLETQGIFQAFNIPSSYMEPNVEYTTFLGLKSDSSALTGYDADLITIDNSKSGATYYDTVRPVPPFDVAPPSSFYLLSLL